MPCQVRNPHPHPHTRGKEHVQVLWRLCKDVVVSLRGARMSAAALNEALLHGRGGGGGHRRQPAPRLCVSQPEPDAVVRPRDLPSRAAGPILVRRPRQVLGRVRQPPSGAP